MDVRGESPGNPLSEWVSSLIWPIVNGMIILTFFPLPYLLVSERVQKFPEYFQSWNDISEYVNKCGDPDADADSNTDADADAAQHVPLVQPSPLDRKENYNNETTNPSVDFCETVSIIKSFLAADITALLSSISLFGLILISVLLIILHKFTNWLFYILFGSTDVDEPYLAKHPEIAGDLKIKSALAAIRRFYPTSRSNEEFKFHWEYVKNFNDKQDNLIIYHRKRDSIIYRMYDCKRFSTFSFSYAILAITIYLAYSLFSQLPSNPVPNVYYFYIAITMFILNAIGCHYYLQRCLELAKTDFHQYVDWHAQTQTPLKHSITPDATLWRRNPFLYVAPIRGGFLTVLVRGIGAWLFRRAKMIMKRMLR